MCDSGTAPGVPLSSPPSPPAGTGSAISRCSEQSGGTHLLPAHSSSVSGRPRDCPRRERREGPPLPRSLARCVLCSPGTTAWAGLLTTAGLGLNSDQVAAPGWTSRTVTSPELFWRAEVRLRGGKQPDVLVLARTVAGSPGAAGRARPGQPTPQTPPALRGWAQRQTPLFQNLETR